MCHRKGSEREEGERVTERDRNRGMEREGMCIDVTDVTLTQQQKTIKTNYK